MNATSLKLTRVGNSTAVIIPKEILSNLNLKKGDTLYCTVDQQSIQLTPCDPEFMEDMTLAAQIIREDRDVLQKLAQ